MQKEPGLVSVSDRNPNLLFSRVKEEVWLQADADVRVHMQHVAETYAASIGAAVRFWMKQECRQAELLPDMKALTASMKFYDGGNCAFESYMPQRKKAYVIVPEKAKSGDRITTEAFNRTLVVEVPTGATAGSQLEISLLNEFVSVAIVSNDTLAGLPTLLRSSCKISRF